MTGNYKSCLALKGKGEVLGMLSLLITFCVFAVFTKVCLLVLKIVGKVFGFMFGIIGYLILGVLAMSLFGAALASIMVIVFICIALGAGIAAVH